MTGQAATILDIRDIRKNFGAYQALKGVSLSVAQGEFIALVGPSGCGKTTLLKQIAGFETPDSGSLSIDGQDMLGVPAAARPTSMVFQKLALFPHMTVADNIGFPLKLRKVAADVIARRVRDMIELMQLKPEFLARYPRQLSGGEQQRVALARSMISEPKLLLLDEPLSALDVKLKKVLQAELKRLHRSVGVTFVHVTHDLEEAMMLADRICVMRAGEILQVGQPNDIYYRPADAFVAGFIGDTNLLPVTVTGVDGAGAAISAPGLFDRARLPVPLVAPSLAAGPAHLMVRPELLAPLAAGQRAEFELEARVSEIFSKGGTVQYRSILADGSPLIFELAGSSTQPAQIGDVIRLGFANRDIYLFPGGQSR
ncbi:spermidine/putrescine transport system ATP-binding protein [Dongia mobilis]|uniref:Spermidine/putrescine transport system ATP-binding protein n=1 Tax=Dongia mobilis TaxID=578943 RepID=A0A4V3DFF8_9PROT|nr:ABC transporter ATP-binding protein [Dongia mobilis]TDQ86415.1 spermidine/putrescine transport system ATP-binding protein [Dongia mobilis]